MTDEEKLNKLFEPDFPPYTYAPDSNVQDDEDIIAGIDFSLIEEQGFPENPFQQEEDTSEQTPYQRYQDLSKEERRRKYAERLGFEQEVRKQGIIEQLKNKFKKHQ